MTLLLKGATPSKKSLYQIITRRDGKASLAISGEAKQLIASLQLQAQARWKQPQLIHPAMSVQFSASNENQDRDGMWVTALDVLQAAAVIKNDSIKWFNGPIVIEPALICPVGEEQVRIKIHKGWVDPTGPPGSYMVWPVVAV